MAHLTISAVAQEVGLKPSALRYYEEIGLLPHAQRVSGQRRYDSTILYRISIIQQAQRVGFTLNEIQGLFAGFESGTRASERWRKLSQRKCEELQVKMEEILSMRKLLERMTSNCQCETLEQCGKKIFEKRSKSV